MHAKLEGLIEIIYPFLMREKERRWEDYGRRKERLSEEEGSAE